jgi:ornithine cyclodeaminase/alanine dehydrogenase-like protein (mu-crystallin family)
MKLVTEAQARACVTLQAAIDMIEEVFVDEHGGRARSLPVVREPLANGKGTFGVKSGEIDRYGIVGLKAGGYWPGNAAAGRSLTNHQSTTLLFDAKTGQALAAVEANWLTEARTAAAGAVAIRALSRPDSRTLGIIGTGMQARSQIEAALLVRNIDRVRVHGRDCNEAVRLCNALAADHQDVEIGLSEAEETVRSSDILITITPSKTALFPAEWSPAGQHINAMGADTIGKQELPEALLQASSLFYDNRRQSLTLGEFQRLAEPELAENAIGAVLAGAIRGRRETGERTIFDSTGISLQDLAAAWACVHAPAP